MFSFVSFAVPWQEYIAQGLSMTLGEWYFPKMSPSNHKTQRPASSTMISTLVSGAFSARAASHQAQLGIVRLLVITSHLRRFHSLECE